MASPTDVTGLVGWFKADSITGLVDGDPVATWPDSSGAANDAAQGTSAKRPVYKTGQINSLPAVRFDSADDNLVSDLAAHQPAQTVFAVFRATTIATRTLRGSNATGPTNGEGGLQFRVESTGALGLVKQALAFIGGGTAGVIAAATWEAGTASYSDSADAYAFYDAGSAAGGSTTSVSLTSSNTWTNLGSNNGTGEFFYGDMAEVIVYDKVLSDTERATVHSYIQDKYGITVSDYSAGSGTDLTVADSTHAHAADTVALTQAHQLAAADAAHGHVADNVTLGVAGVLAVADGAHAHAADNVVLTQVHVLTVADSAHGHTADAVTVTVDTGPTLAVDGGLHAHTADTVTLTQVHVLTVADGVLAHSADVVSLSEPSWILRIPATAQGPRWGRDSTPVQKALYRHIVSIGEPPSVLVTGGVVTEVRHPTTDQIAAADYAFLGGYENEVPFDLVDTLTAAGYTVEAGA